MQAMMNICEQDTQQANAKQAGANYALVRIVMGGLSTSYEDLLSFKMASPAAFSFTRNTQLPQPWSAEP